MQQKATCPELLKATVNISEDYAKVKCKAQKSSFSKWLSAQIKKVMKVLKAWEMS